MASMFDVLDPGKDHILRLTLKRLAAMTGRFSLRALFYDYAGTQVGGTQVLFQQSQSLLTV